MKPITWKQWSQTLHDDPTNYAVRAAFADWLEEQGHPLAEHIRQNAPHVWNTRWALTHKPHSVVSRRNMAHQDVLAFHMIGPDEGDMQRGGPVLSWYPKEDNNGSLEYAVEDWHNENK